MTVYILVVTSWLSSGGQHVAFQEFYDLDSCNANATYLLKRSQTTRAYCTFKGVPVVNAVAGKR